MIRFVDATIPHDTAIKLAVQSDPRTANDHGYVVKASLQEAFGERVVRPWRLLPQFGVYRVLGIIEDAKAVKPNTMSRRLGIVTEVLDYRLGDEEILTLDVETTPIRNYGITKDPDGPKKEGSVVAELIPDGQGGFRIHETRDTETRRLGYEKWLCERLGHDASGLAVIDYPETLDIRPVKHNRRRHADDSIGIVTMPYMRARVQVRIEDLAKADAFLRHGLRKLKDLGLGSMLPASILDPVMAEAA